MAGFWGIKITASELLFRLRGCSGDDTILGAKLMKYLSGDMSRPGAGNTGAVFFDLIINHIFLFIS